MIPCQYPYNQILICCGKPFPYLFQWSSVLDLQNRNLSQNVFTENLRDFSAPTLNTEHYFFSKSLSDQTHTIWHWHFLTFSVTGSLVSNAHTEWIKPNIKIQTIPIYSFQTFSSHLIFSVSVYSFVNSLSLVHCSVHCCHLGNEWGWNMLCALTIQNISYLKNILFLQPCCMEVYHIEHTYP